MKIWPEIKVKFKRKVYYPTIYTVDTANKFITFDHKGEHIVIRNLEKSVFSYTGINDWMGKPIFEGDKVLCRALSTSEIFEVKDASNISAAITGWPSLYKHPKALEIVKQYE
jgi:hypothetical protein